MNTEFHKDHGAECGCFDETGTCHYPCLRNQDCLCLSDAALYCPKESKVKTDETE